MFHSLTLRLLMSYIYMERLFLMFLDHTQRRTTVGRTPLDEWSARRRDLYQTTHDTHNRQIFMPPVGFEPTISAGERPAASRLLRSWVPILLGGCGMWMLPIFCCLFVLFALFSLRFFCRSFALFSYFFLFYVLYYFYIPQPPNKEGN